MTRAWFLSALLCSAGCAGEQSAENEILVYADRYEFQGKEYATEGDLGTALQDHPEMTLVITVRECVNDGRVADLMAMMKQRGQANIAFSPFSGECH